MWLSFDDKESFVDVAGSLRFNNPPSNPSILGEVGSTDNQVLPGVPGKFSAIDSTLCCVLRPWLTGTGTVPHRLGESFSH